MMVMHGRPQAIDGIVHEMRAVHALQDGALALRAIALLAQLDVLARNSQPTCLDGGKTDALKETSDPVIWHPVSSVSALILVDTADHMQAPPAVLHAKETEESESPMAHNSARSGCPLGRPPCQGRGR